MYRILKYAVIALLPITAVAHASEVSIDENKFGGHLATILTSYQACGLPMAALGDIPQRHAAWVKTHTILGKPIGADYAIKAELIRRGRVADPAGFKGFCGRMVSMKVQAVANAKRSMGELQTAHAEAHHTG